MFRKVLLAGLLATRLQAYARKRALRVASGMLILGFGVWGLIGLTRILMASS